MPLNSLLDDFDMSAPSSKKGAPMNAMKHGGVPSASTGRASAQPSGTNTGMGGDAFDALFGLGATSTPTHSAPSDHMPHTTPGAPPTSDFFNSPRMGPGLGATPARAIPSLGADPFGGLGGDNGLFGSLGSSAPGGGTPMGASMGSMGSSMSRMWAKPTPSQPIASPASEDLLGAILGDTGSRPGSGLGSRLGSESDFSNAGGGMGINPGTSTITSSLGGSANDLGTASGGMGQFASRGGSSNDLSSNSGPDGFAGFEDFVNSAAAQPAQTLKPSAMRSSAAEFSDRNRSGFGGLEDLVGVSSQQPSQSVSRSASANDFDMFGGDNSGASPSVSSPDIAALTADSGGFAGLEDFISPKAAPSGSTKQNAPTSLDAGLEAMLDELSMGGNASGGGFNSGGPVIIDDMFGPAMGSSVQNQGGEVAGDTCHTKVVSNDIAYESSDDEGHEGDSDVRKKARAARHERNRQRITQKLQEKRDREANALAEQAERQVLNDLIGADIDEWLRKNQNNIRTMLANLANVLWEGHGYKSPDLNALLSPNAVKKSYHKALVIIHPDKVRQKFGGDMDKVFIADKVFDQVRDAFKDFSGKEL